MVKVSIIIPVYNVEKYLEDCLKSVINQSLKDIEIICVNDGSTDRSFDILNKYAVMDNRITVINNSKNYGLSYSRNQGIQYSHGEYIYFLDSDDMITQEAMEELYNISKQDALDAVFFDAMLIFETEELKKKFAGYNGERNKEYSGIFVGQDLFVHFIQNRDWMSIVQRQFWRREYLLNNDLNFYEGILHEDELFSFKALLKANRVCCIKKKYFIRRLRENSIMTTTLSKKNLEGLFVSYCQMLAFWQASKFNEKTNVAVEFHLSALYKRVKAIYKSICNTEDIQRLDHGGIIENHLFQLFISNIQEGRICKSIEKDKLNVIKQYKNVIIYGAGVVARDVLEILDKNEIGILGFAVTEKEGNPKYVMGLPVYKIDELVEYKEEAIVLLAVVSKYHESILKKLNELKFRNIMKIV